jgi:hypothetical protein
MGGKRQAGWPFSLVSFLFTPGILPYALRASFAVRARSCVRVATQRESNSASAGGRKLFAFEMASINELHRNVTTIEPPP